ncbi:MAG TPA: GldG family protein, partial [Polyangiaceae bacterium]
MASVEQRRKVAAQAGFYLLVVAAIVVVVNMLSSKLYQRWDVTKAERYTLSQGSGRLIQSLKTPIQVDAYVKTGLPQLDAFVRDLTDLLKEYERAGKGKFKFTIIEPNTDELREQAKEAGLQEQPFGEVSATGDDQASIAQGYLGLVFKYGSEKAVIPQLFPNQTDGLEFWITNKMREIRDKADNIKHRIGVITNKDELKLSDTNLVPKQGRGGGSPSLQSIMEQAFPFYKLEEVDLKDGSSEIDKDLVGLIITQPQKDYTEKELRRIDEFMLRGGKSLVVWASAVTLKPNDATMKATLSTHGLEKLLTGYGIQMNKDAVLDFGAQFRIGAMSPQTG